MTEYRTVREQLRRPPAWGPNDQGDLMVDMTVESYERDLDRLAAAVWDEAVHATRHAAEHNPYRALADVPPRLRADTERGDGRVAQSGERRETPTGWLADLGQVAEAAGSNPAPAITTSANPIVDAMALADQWERDAKRYPADNAIGEAARVAVRLCAKELRAALDPPQPEAADNLEGR